MEALSLRVWYGGIYGRVACLWWGRVCGGHFAISIEINDLGHKYWFYGSILVEDGGIRGLLRWRERRLIIGVLFMARCIRLRR
jgi:hypothetical protein